jgi:uncharacterized protein GlcG (DUF336 family)
MNNQDAKRVLAAAVAKADELGRKVSIAVVDAAGTMLVFERATGANPFTASLAEGKAATAAYTGRETQRMQGMAETRPYLVAPLVKRLGERFVPVEGGVPILAEDGAVIGAVGVSGAASEEDGVIAKAGIAAL